MPSNKDIGEYVTALSTGYIGKCNQCGLIAPGVLQCNCDHASWDDLSAEDKGQAIVAYLEGRTAIFKSQS